MTDQQMKKEKTFIYSPEFCNESRYDGTNIMNSEFTEISHFKNKWRCSK